MIMIGLSMGMGECTIISCSVSFGLLALGKWKLWENEILQRNKHWLSPSLWRSSKKGCSSLLLQEPIYATTSFRERLEIDTRNENVHPFLVSLRIHFHIISLLQNIPLTSLKFKQKKEEEFSQQNYYIYNIHINKELNIL